MAVLSKKLHQHSINYCLKKALQLLPTYFFANYFYILYSFVQFKRIKEAARTEMEFKKLVRHKWFKIFGLPLLGLLVLLLLVEILLNIYFSPVLSKQLKSTVSRLSNGLYQVDFANSSLHMLPGFIVIEHLSLKPDMAVFNRLKKAGTAPNNLYTLSVERIVLKNMHPYEMYFEKRLDVKAIELKNPTIRIVYRQLHNHDLPDSGKKTFYQRIAGSLKSVHIGQILLTNIHLLYQDELNNEVKITRLKDVDVTGTDLLIDSSSQFDKTQFNFFKDITAVFHNYHGLTTNQLYRYHAGSVTFSSAKARVKIADAVFMPVKSATENEALARRNFSLQTDSILISRFDYHAFISYRKFIAADVNVYGNKASVFYNGTLPRASANLSKSGLYGLLKNVHRSINIKNVHINDLDVVYTEISAKTKLKGNIIFKKSSGTISNIITGEDTLLHTNRKLTANFSTYLMGYGKLDLKLQFDPADTSNILYYQGNLKSMNLVNLNPATKPLGLIQFTNGIVTTLNFTMQANAKKATGKVTFLYQDLNVMLLREDEKNTLKRMPFISILANAFVLIRDNPRFNDSVRVINVVYNRPENSSYLGLLWRSVYSGIKESIGLSAEIEQNLRQKAADYKQNKQERVIQKAERQEKRKMRRLRRIEKRALKEARG